MFFRSRTALMVALASMTGTAVAADLQGPDAFADIVDDQARSIALFEEAGKVLTHPRCVNCHPKGDAPLQNAMLPHQPPVIRGDGGLGAPGMRCGTCHGAENYDPAGVPGHEVWHLAPIEMAWQDKSLGEICVQIKDPERNGERTMDELVEHMAEDGLVGWAWHPGEGREPAPGSQEVFGTLMAAWAETGAACPDA